jgi:hypothetical protein
MPSSEELDPDPLLLLIEELDTFDPGKGANGGIQSLDLPTLASSSEAGNDPNGGIQFASSLSKRFLLFRCFVDAPEPLLLAPEPILLASGLE